MLLSRLTAIVQTLRKERFFLIAPVTLGVIFVSALGVYFFEYSVSGSSIRSLWDGIWWAFVTICTVGYGDKFPVSDGGRIVGIFLMISGVGLLSMLTATVASVLVEQKIREGKGLEAIKRKDHLVICGWNGNSEEVLTGLLRNEADRRAIVLINELPVDEVDSLKLKYDKYGMIFLRGDFVQEDVLLRADIRKAQFVMIMADFSGRHPKERTDDRTILAALTAKSLAPQVKVIAELIDSDNRIHLKRANVITGGDTRKWGGHYWGANQSCIYNALLPTNRLELLDPMFDMYSGMYESCALGGPAAMGQPGDLHPGDCRLRRLGQAAGRYRRRDAGPVPAPEALGPALGEVPRVRRDEAGVFQPLELARWRKMGERTLGVHGARRRPLRSRDAHLLPRSEDRLPLLAARRILDGRRLAPRPRVPHAQRRGGILPQLPQRQERGRRQVPHSSCQQQRARLGRTGYG